MLTSFPRKAANSTQPRLRCDSTHPLPLLRSIDTYITIWAAGSLHVIETV